MSERSVCRLRHASREHGERLLDVHRLEDHRFITGRGQYVDDVVLPGQCHLRVVRSPHAHASIRSIDIRAAREFPGVLAVLTADEMRADSIGEIGCHFYPEDLYSAPPSRRIHRSILADGVVRHIGDRVAVIVAETAQIARDAAELVVVEYEALPSIATVEEAVAAEAPRLWPEAPGNILFQYSLGDNAATTAALERARHLVSLDLVNQRVAALPLEQRGALGQYDQDNGYVLHTSAQSPHRLRTQLAQSVLHENENRIRVIVKDVGGAFGLKVALFPEEALVLWSAMKTGRPVKWSPDRSESFLSDDHARDQKASLTMGLDAEGRITAVKATLTSNLGAYLASTGTVPAIFGPQMLTGIYDIPAAHVTVTGVVTNTQPTGPYRGAGRPEAIYAIERLIERAAAELGVETIALRRKNAVRASQMPYRTALGAVYDCGDFAQPFDRALALADWDDFESRRRASARQGKLRGIGVASYIEVVAFFNDQMEIHLEPDGSATVIAGSVSSGQGHATVYAELLREWLGIAPERVRLLQGDTAVVSFGRGTFGSRSMTVCGSALKMATDKLVAKGKNIAAELLEASVEDICFEPGRFSVTGTDRQTTLQAVAAAAYRGTVTDTDNELGLRAAATFNGPPANYPNGCNVCEVEIDPETGAIEIVRFVAVDDCGRVLDSTRLEGQIHGGLAQGIGQALFEEMVFDSDGQLMSGSLMDYGVPRATSLPNFTVETIEIPTATNPLGVKGAGEAGCVSAPGAVVNAVLNALKPLGVESIDMPLTPPRVWRAIQGSTTRKSERAAAAQ
jgi:carbon-monoxide dehydrogenase large subunit